MERTLLQTLILTLLLPLGTFAQPAGPMYGDHVVVSEPAYFDDDEMLTDQAARILDYAGNIRSRLSTLRHDVETHGNTELLPIIDGLEAQLDGILPLVDTGEFEPAWQMLQEVLTQYSGTLSTLVRGGYLGPPVWRPDDIMPSDSIGVPLPDTNEIGGYIGALTQAVEILRGVIDELGIEIAFPADELMVQLDSARDMLAAGDLFAAMDVARAVAEAVEPVARGIIPGPIPADATFEEYVSALNYRIDFLDILIGRLPIDLFVSLDVYRSKLDSSEVLYGNGDTEGAWLLAHEVGDTIGSWLRDLTGMIVPWEPGGGLPPYPSEPDSATVAAMIQELDTLADSLDGVLEALNLSQADDLLSEAEADLDSATNALADGSIYLAARYAHSARRLLGEVERVIAISSEVTSRIPTLRAEVDSLRDVIADDPVQNAAELLDTADAALDSAAAHLEDGEIVAAGMAMHRAERAVHRVRELLRLKGVVETGLASALDYLAELEEMLPDGVGEEALVRAHDAADSVQARLDAGAVYAAEASLRRLDEAVNELALLISRYEVLSHAIEDMRQELTDAAQTIEAAGDSVAENLYEAVVQLTDTAEDLLASGNVRAAEAHLQSAHRKLEQALFLVNGYDIVEAAIAELRDRVETLLAELPADAYYERGAVNRVAVLADSAAVLLAEGEVNAALRVVERSNRALDRIIGGPNPDHVDINAQLQNARCLVGMAQSLLDSTIIGTAEGDTANALIARSLALIEKVQMALMSGAPMGPSTEELVEWIGRAERYALLAIDILSADVPPDVSTDADAFFADDEIVDPITADIYAAAEKAARDAGVPTSVETQTALPAEYALSNAPNPFNPSTTIRFALPEAGIVRVDLYNVAGQRVRTLVDEARTAGVHTVEWDGRDETGHQMASGVYIARLRTESEIVVARLTLVR